MALQRPQKTWALPQFAAHIKLNLNLAGAVGKYGYVQRSCMFVYRNGIGISVWA